MNKQPRQATVIHHGTCDLSPQSHWLSCCALLYPLSTQECARYLDLGTVAPFILLFKKKKKKNLYLSDM